MKINFSTNGTLEDHFLKVVEANKAYELQNNWLRYYNECLKTKLNKGDYNIAYRLKKVEAQNKKLKNSIHKAYTKHIKPQQAKASIFPHKDNEPRTIGLRYYTGTLKPSQRFAKCDWQNGCHSKYRFSFKKEYIDIETENFHFVANSRKEAESFLCMPQIEKLQFNRMLTPEESLIVRNSKSYNS